MTGGVRSPHLRPVDPAGGVVPGIAQGMVITGGQLLVLSGHVPLDADGAVVGTDHAAQLEQVFVNMLATLAAAGGDFGSVARLTFYVRDYRPELLPVIRSVRDRWIDSARPPASALIGVAALFHSQVLIEVDGLAVIGR
ncbi:Rid family hydrolase [Sphingomonas sp. CFBP 13720]|uniref:Rid family hydrolase n=1 Tax=Sphingomonas sp. CFBP 13720 TaxID=2775302 RepID=UPI0018D5DA43